MITYEFASADPKPVFVTFPGETNITDYLDVPVRIRIPHHLAIEVGLDRLQGRIIAAMDTVVETLKRDCKIS